jgi:hypothetical protein
MSEQIITILLSTMLGGVLTIAGGLAVSYVTHQQASKDEKRKELRDAIEKIFEQTWIIDTAFRNSVNHQDYLEELDRNLKLIIQSMQEIRTLVSLYVPGMKKETEKYLKTLSPMFIMDYIHGKIENEEFSRKLQVVSECIFEYHRELALFLQKQ